MPIASWCVAAERTIVMATIQSSDVRDPYRPGAMPLPPIPIRHTAWFLWMLWALAGFLIVGMVYSFWRIATVPTPTLEVPVTAPTVTDHTG
jgi:hypothetical protein